MIDYDLELMKEKPKLQVCKNDLNRTEIANIKEAYAINHKLSLGNVNELSFSIPFNVEYHNKHKKNKNESEIKERRIIKLTKGTFHEYYIVHKITKNMDDGNEHKRVECYSLAYELADKQIKDLSLVSKNATQQLNTVLAETIWKIDYINAEFDTLYRGLEVSSSTVLDVVQQIAETFNALIIYDTINRKISFYNFEHYGQFRGLSAKYGKLLKNITYETNTAEYCTRLKVFGKDGVSINSANSTGTNYLDDYSSLLYGFQRNPDKTVISSAQDISDSLANALLDYQILVESKQGDFTTLLNNWNVKNDELIVANGQLIDLQGELALIEDSISTMNATGGNPAPYIAQKVSKDAQITAKKTAITTIKASITTINGQITTLNNTLKIENNFTEDQLKEWNVHIVVKEWSNQYIDDPKQLLEAGKEELVKMREPKIVVSIGIVNFLEVLSEHHNWDKLNLGDIFRIDVDRIGVKVDAKILEIDFDYESADVTLTIGNIKEILNDEQRFMKNFYKTVSSSTTFNNNQYKYLDAYGKSNATYEMFSEKLDATKLRIESSYDESITIDRKGVRATSPSNPNDVLIIQSGVLAISNTGGNYWNTVMDASGVYAERLVGRILAGNDLTIENSSGSFQVNATGVTITDMNLSLTTTNVKSKININPTLGIQIQKNTGTNGAPVWVNQFSVDANGEAIFGGNIIVGSGSSVFRADTNGIYLGHNTFSSAPFRVTTAGAATMSSLNMTGGTITLGQNFSVNAAGVATMTGANISGNITMTSGSISWGSVGKPSYSAFEVGALATSSPMLTHIDSSGIYTGTLSANQINAGTITASRISGGTLSGVTISVSTDATIGNILFMRDTTFRNGIRWGTDIRSTQIYIDPSGNGLFLETASNNPIGGGGIYANGHRIDVPPTARFA